WAEAAFASGGIEPIAPPPSEGSRSLEAWRTSFQESGASLAMICGTDAHYAAEAGALAKALRSAGARRVYVIGAPGDLATPLAESGVSTFLYAGMDLLAALQEIHSLFAESP
ncbi:MAG: methylmalonyl-CoA mutase, partial [Myxococcales bacterium]|nr:methylmalonyl-CoA mutase [Myxococcales bacterium]